MYGYEIFHNKIAQGLIENVRTGKNQHAYIFEGENGVGHFETAKMFANALVCERQADALCGVCSACIKAAAATHPDITFVKPKDNKKNITVDVIRNISADVYVKPFESRNKVYIFESEMNEQAQNALLKILEEPPLYAVFIILSENSQNLLETIRSRCTLIHFAPVGDEKIKEYILRKFPDEKERLDFLVHYSQGIAGNAEKIIASENFTTLREKSFDMLLKLLSERSLEAYDVAEFMDENKEDADLILQFWLDYIHDIILIQNGGEKITANSDMMPVITRCAKTIDERRVLVCCEQLILAGKMRKRYVSLRMLTLRLAFKIKFN